MRAMSPGASNRIFYQWHCKQLSQSQQLQFLLKKEQNQKKTKLTVHVILTCCNFDFQQLLIFSKWLNNFLHINLYMIFKCLLVPILSFNNHWYPKKKVFDYILVSHLLTHPYYIEISILCLISEDLILILIK